MNYSKNLRQMFPTQDEFKSFYVAHCDDRVYPSMRGDENVTRELAQAFPSMFRGMSVFSVRDYRKLVRFVRWVPGRKKRSHQGELMPHIAPSQAVVKVKHPGNIASRLAAIESKLDKIQNALGI
jgi:hypothetical protein